MNTRANAHKLIFLAALTIALLVTACSEKPKIIQQEGPITSLTVVATVDTAKIYLGDVLNKYSEFTAPGSGFDATLENALNELIYNRCAFMDADDFRDYDKREVHRLVSNRAREVVVKYMFDDLFSSRVQISPSSIDSVYRANLEHFIKPAKRRVTHLLVSLNKKAWEADGVDVSGLTNEQLSERAKEQIDRFYQQVKNGADLGELAAKYSHDSSSKPKKGDSGLFGRGAMVEPFEQVAFRLPQGALSTPFKSVYGWHILRVEEVIDSSIIPLDSTLRASLERQLKAREVEKLATAFVDSVALAAKIDWNEKLLQKEPGQYDPNDWAMIVNRTDTMEAGVLRELELVYRTGGKRGPVTVDVRKEILLKRMSGLALMSVARQLGYLEREPMKEALSRLQREEVVSCMYRKRTAVSDKQPTEAELREFYERHKEDYISDRPLKVQQVLLPDSLTAAMVKRQAEAGVDFGELAKKYNPAKPMAKETEFDLGWISEKDVPLEFFGAGWIAEVGRFAGPVQTRWGWHVIKVIGHKPQLEYESARVELGRAIRLDRLAQAKEKWAKDIVSGHEIVRYNDILSQIDLTKREYYFNLADSLSKTKIAADSAQSGS